MSNQKSLIVIQVLQSTYGGIAFQIVIIGCGVAGFTAARTITEKYASAEVSIYTCEDHIYYPRPRLYEVISGDVCPKDLYMYPSQWYEERTIKLNLKRKVLAIDVADKELTLDDQSSVNYEKLILANGAHSFLPSIKGVEKNGVFTLRSIKDAVKIRDCAMKTKMVIIVGCGLLGLEMAASLRKIGKEVEAVELMPRLLPKQLDDEGSNLLKDRIESLGIKISLGVKTEEITGSKVAKGIFLDSGVELSGSLVLISAGVRPNRNLAVDAGINVDRGVLVDEHMQTGGYDVYAAGDVVEFKGRTYGIIPAALDQARIAALNVMGEERHVYQGTMQSNSLKIIDIDLTSMGLVNPQGSAYDEIREINHEKGIYRKIILDQGKIVGVIILGTREGVTSFKRLMDREIDVSRYKDTILKESFDFKKILH